MYRVCKYCVSDVQSVYNYCVSDGQIVCKYCVNVSDVQKLLSVAENNK
jgi:hypothetical protein